MIGYVNIVLMCETNKIHRLEYRLPLWDMKLRETLDSNYCSQYSKLSATCFKSSRLTWPRVQKVKLTKSCTWYSSLAELLKYST